MLGYIVRHSKGVHTAGASWFLTTITETSHSTHLVHRSQTRQAGRVWRGHGTWRGTASLRTWGNEWAGWWGWLGAASSWGAHGSCQGEVACQEVSYGPVVGTKSSTSKPPVHYGRVRYRSPSPITPCLVYGEGDEHPSRAAPAAPHSTMCVVYKGEGGRDNTTRGVRQTCRDARWVENKIIWGSLLTNQWIK